MEAESPHITNCFVVKVCVLGDSLVGKSSLAIRFTRNAFYPNLLPTLGSGFLTRCLKGEKGEMYKLQIWDTAGQERYKSLAPLYYRGASIILFVYDVTNRDSLITGAMRWARELRQIGQTEAVFALVGNKSDAADALREVKEEEAKRFAKQIGAFHYETSAKSGHNVTELFTKLCSSVEKERKSLPCKNNTNASMTNRPKETISKKRFYFFHSQSSIVKQPPLPPQSLQFRLNGEDFSDDSCCLT